MHAPTPVPFPVIAIGASAGGMEALWALLAGLPRNLPAAVLVMTHIPAHSEIFLDQVLAMRSVLPVKAVDDGEALRAGWVYVPRTDHHLMIDGPVIRSARGPKECRAPSHQRVVPLGGHRSANPARRRCDESDASNLVGHGGGVNQDPTFYYLSLTVIA